VNPGTPGTAGGARTAGRFVVVPAAYVYLRRGDEVLLQLRRGTGYMDDHWAAAAAGHVERGETAYDAARREAAEELDVHDLGLDFVTTMHRTARAAPIDERVDFFFTARRWSGEPRVVEPDKCARIAWWPLDGLPDPTVPHERVVLESLREGGVTAYTTHGFADAATVPPAPPTDPKETP